MSIIKNTNEFFSLLSLLINVIIFIGIFLFFEAKKLHVWISLGGAHTPA